jgi:hypothetical protein
MSRRVLALASLVTASLAVLVLPVAAADGASPRSAVPVRVVFTGKGGGRYLDVTRWLEEDTRECYARQTTDETLSVSWTITWNAQLVTRNGRRELVPRRRAASKVDGRVQGITVRDYCDEPEDGPDDVGPDWPGTTRCDGSLGVRSSGSLASRPTIASTLVFRGPEFGSPPRPCDLSVRNDQLVADVLARQSLLAKVAASGRAVSEAVGTHHPTAGSHYEATRTCSDFPHRYDGIVYLYDCEDTLVWDGKVTIARVLP